MNWTGGRLHSNLKGNGSAIRKKQREHFAKVRNKLQTNPRRSSPLRHYFEEEENDQPLNDGRTYKRQRQSRLEEYENVALVAERLTRMTNLANNGQQKLTPSARRRPPANNEGGGIDHPSFEIQNKATHHHEIDPQKSAGSREVQDDEYENQRANLLQQDDWLGLQASKPLQIDFSANRDRDLIGKRRKITSSDRMRQQPAGRHRYRVPSIAEDCARARATYGPAPEANMRIRIGDDALNSRLSILTDSQDPRSKRTRTQSWSSALLNMDELLHQSAPQHDFNDLESTAETHQVAPQAPEIVANSNSEEFILLEDGHDIQDYPELFDSSVFDTSDLPSSHLRLKHSNEQSINSKTSKESHPVNPDLHPERPKSPIHDIPARPSAAQDTTDIASPSKSPIPSPTPTQPQSHIAVVGSPSAPINPTTFHPPLVQPRQTTTKPKPPHTEPQAPPTHSEPCASPQPNDSISVAPSRPRKNPKPTPKAAPQAMTTTTTPQPSTSPSRSYMDLLNLIHAPVRSETRVLLPRPRPHLPTIITTAEDVPAQHLPTPTPAAPTAAVAHHNPQEQAPPAPTTDKASALNHPQNPNSNTNDKKDNNNDELTWRAFIFASSPSPSPTSANGNARQDPRAQTQDSRSSVRATQHTLPSPSACSSLLSSPRGSEGAVLDTGSGSCSAESVVVSGGAVISARSGGADGESSSPDPLALTSSPFEREVAFATGERIRRKK